mgnify:FL=1
MSWAQFVEWEAFYMVDALLQKEMQSGKSAAEALKVVETIIELHKE